jgi:hypothetical protein
MPQFDSINCMVSTLSVISCTVSISTFLFAA